MCDAIDFGTTDDHPRNRSNSVTDNRQQPRRSAIAKRLSGNKFFLYYEIIKKYILLLFIWLLLTVDITVYCLNDSPKAAFLI